MSMSVNSTGLKKRRRNDETRTTKFYAVRVGLRPGVYGTWKECHEQIDRFKGARYKAFATYKDAQDFVAGKLVKNQADSTQAEKFYGVAVGHRPGVYTDWTEASLQIKDVKRPKYKKFLTRAEAEYFVKTKGKELGDDVAREHKDVDSDKKYTIEQDEDNEDENHEEGDNEGDEFEDDEEEDEDEDEEEPPTVKRCRISEAGISKNFGLDYNIVTAYTDGSSRGNGKIGARAGVGVFFGTNDPRNVSEPLQGEPQTNQRAELTAVLRALQICPENKNIQIFTDSTYSINCLTKWYKAWLKNKWRNSSGSPVLNQDLIKAVRTLMDRRGVAGVTTELTWVRGHSNNPGNEAADRLAVAGSMAAF